MLLHKLIKNNKTTILIFNIAQLIIITLYTKLIHEILLKLFICIRMDEII